MSSSANSLPEIDKEQLYGNFLEHERARLKANRQLSAKGKAMALDVAFEPDDDTRINVEKRTTNVNGIGTKGLIGLALALGVPGLGAAYIISEAMKHKDTVKEVVEKVIPGETKTITILKDKEVEIEVIPPSE